MRTAFRLGATVAVLACVVAACGGDRPPEVQEIEPRAADEVVQALASAYAAYVGRELPVSVMDGSWNNIADRELASRMRELLESTVGETPWVLEFLSLGSGGGGEVYATMHDAEDPHCCSVLAVEVRRGGRGNGWSVGEGRIAGYATVARVVKRVAEEKKREGTVK